MKKPLVSVIIPTFNREGTIKSAIESVLKQDYAPLELIVVDDASTDNTISMLKQIKDSRLSIHQHRANRGANAARNTGATHSHGDWLAFLDSDDTWQETKISTMMDALLKPGEVYQVGYCGVNIQGKNEKIKEIPAFKTGNLFEDLLPKNVIGSFSVPVLSKDVFNEVGGSDENLKSAQDWDLWLRISQKGYLFKAIPESLVNYNNPSSGEHISNNLDSFIAGRNSFLEKHQKLYKGQNATLSFVYRDMAFLLLLRFNKPKIARKYFLKALSKNWVQIKGYKGIFGTLFPEKVYQKLS